MFGAGYVKRTPFPSHLPPSLQPSWHMSPSPGAVFAQACSLPSAKSGWLSLVCSGLSTWPRFQANASISTNMMDSVDGALCLSASISSLDMRRSRLYWRRRVADGLSAHKGHRNLEHGSDGILERCEDCASWSNVYGLSLNWKLAFPGYLVIGKYLRLKVPRF